MGRYWIVIGEYRTALDRTEWKLPINMLHGNSNRLYMRDTEPHLIVIF